MNFTTGIFQVINNNTMIAWYFQTHCDIIQIFHKRNLYWRHRSILTNFWKIILSLLKKCKLQLKKHVNIIEIKAIKKTVWKYVSVKIRIIWKSVNWFDLQINWLEIRVLAERYFQTDYKSYQQLRYLQW